MPAFLQAALARGTRASGLPGHIVLDRGAVSGAEGVRAALSVAAIVALAGFVTRPELMAAALAAWLTCLGDAGGAIRRRVPALIAFAVIGALLTGGLGLLRTAPLPVVIPVASLVIFCLGFARVWGPWALQVGNLLAAAAVLALRAPHGATDALDAGLLFLMGSLWAVLLTMAIWRLHPYRPARRAVAGCYVALAALTADLRQQLRQDDGWERHMRGHRRTVREAIEAARATVLAAVRDRGPVPGRAAESWIRLEVADHLFGALIGLSDLLEAGLLEAGAAAGSGADPLLRRLRAVLSLLAEAIRTGRPAPAARLSRTVAAMEASLPPGSPLRPVAARIAEQLDIAVTLAAADTSGAGAELPATWQDRWLQPVRANLDPGSAVLRHALRMAAVALVGFTVTLVWPTSYGHWLTITALLTMQPFFAPTLTRVAERIAGAVAGGFVAAAIGLVASSPLVLAALLFPLTLLTLSLRRVNYGLFNVGITPIVVLLSEIASPADGQIHIALMRGFYTLLGGLLALAGTFVLWPSWEPGRLRRELGAALAAHGRYARTELSAVLGEADAAAVDAARRAAGLASNNLEASLQRALLEPRSRPGALEAAMTADAALRRMAGRLSALDMDRGRGHDPAVWHAWRDWIDEAASRLSRGVTVLPDRPPPPDRDRQADTLLRLARQIELAAGALGRMA